MKNKKKIDQNKMHEVAIIYKRPLFNKMPHVKTSEDANILLRKVIDLAYLDHKEFFWVLLLNNSNRVLGVAEIGKGDTKGVVVNIKEIFQLTLKANASGIILCHNHPSGVLIPSESDKAITKKIKTIAELFSITLIDHIIITSEHYFSFVDECQL